MSVGYGAIAWIPSYLVRSHGLNIAQAGAYLASRHRHRGRRRHMARRISQRPPAQPRCALVAVAGCARLRGGAALRDGILLGRRYRLALTLFAFPAAVGAMHIGPSVAVLHERMEARLRPLASALFLMLLTLVGMGLGPLAVGVMSQTVFAGARRRFAALRAPRVAARRLVGRRPLFTTLARASTPAEAAQRALCAEAVAVLQRRNAEAAHKQAPQAGDRAKTAACGNRLGCKVGLLEQPAGRLKARRRYELSPASCPVSSRNTRMKVRSLIAARLASVADAKIALKIIDGTTSAPAGWRESRRTAP